ncbi:MAG: hypothetical protein ACRCWF_05585 [Beijerinckiaceae bacterium]
MEKDYPYAPTAQGQQSISSSVGTLLDIVHTLASEVQGFSDRLHGDAPASSGALAANKMSGAADELRASIASAEMRARATLKEVNRIRETIGL